MAGPVLRFALLMVALLIALVVAQTPTDPTATNTTVPSGTTTPPATATTTPAVTTPFPTTPPPTASGCQLADPANTSKICPKFKGGVYYPLGLKLWDVQDPAPYLLYPKIKAVACKACESSLSTDYACSLMLTQYNQYCKTENDGLNIPLKLACRYDCAAAEKRCANTNTTFTGVRFWNCGQTGAGNSIYLTCNIQNALQDDCCQSNRKADVCNPPSWLAAKAGGAPRWVWIFVVGGILLLLIIIAIFVYMHYQKRETLEHLFHPCQWCECCPSYYDL